MCTSACRGSWSTSWSQVGQYQRASIGVPHAGCRAAYQLTAEGAELAGALRLLASWGAGHTDLAEAPRHPACGTPIEARWYCPTCDQLVDHEPRQAEVHIV